MSNCCHDKACALDVLRRRQAATLWVVLAINAVMFVVEVWGSFHASSTALLSDSLDNLGDALTYAISLLVVGGSARDKARVALLKGALILFAAFAVVGQIAYRLVTPETPLFAPMGSIAVVALVGNVACLALLQRHRYDDINMSSVWECSRNDIVANLAVIVAAVAVWTLGAGWPDLIVAAALAAVFLFSAIRVLGQAARQLLHPKGDGASLALVLPQHGRSGVLGARAER